MSSNQVNSPMSAPTRKQTICATINSDTRTESFLPLKFSIMVPCIFTTPIIGTCSETKRCLQMRLDSFQPQVKYFEQQKFCFFSYNKRSKRTVCGGPQDHRRSCVYATLSSVPFVRREKRLLTLHNPTLPLLIL